MRAALLALALICVPALGWAEALEASPRPLLRPVAAAPEVPRPLARPATPVAAEATGIMRPKTRPAPTPTLQMAGALPQRLTIAGSSRSLRPMPRPRDLAAPEPRAVVLAAAIAPPSTALTRSKKGSVCGDPAIKGEVLAPITARIKGCGVAEPVRVSSVDGVALSTPAIMNCTTATALRRWVDRGLQPALAPNRAVKLQIAGDYACRPRNNVKGAKISEHGRGKAIDIAAVVLADGSRLTVADNWNRTLRRVYKAACGIFGTTLGPGSDGYHEDHMHFDTASRRSAYCR